MGNQSMTQLILADLKGFIFTCTDASQEDCFNRLLFGTSKIYGSVAMRVKKGSFLFLLNLDSDLLYGVFRAASDAGVNLDQEAWNGNYPYQVKIEPIWEITPLRNGKKLIKKLGISRSAPMAKSATMTLLELYRSEEMSRDKWHDQLFKEKTSELKISSQPKSWTFLPKIGKFEEEKIEEIPQLEATTLWDFPRQNYGKTPKGDNKYPGVTPAALIWNLVWRYTEPGDLVVDPMCGSGTTLDVCKEEGRRAICYDIAPTRTDIVQNDARKIPLPDNHVDLEDRTNRILEDQTCK